MAQTILLKKSPTPSNVPATLAFGELAINYADSIMYFKNLAGSIVALNSWSNLVGKPTTLSGFGITDPVLTTASSFAGDVSGTYGALTLPASGATAGTYGSTSQVAQITVDAKGRVTAAAAVTVTPAAIGAISITQLGAASGVATLDGTGKLTTAQIPASLIGGLNYQGTWNASTNSPALTSSTGTKGFYYKVATAGATSLDGISSWSAGDSVVFDGTTWDKIDGIANEVITVAGRSGTVVLTATDVGLGNVTNVAQLAATQTLAHTGDVTSPATALSTGTVALTLAASGVTAGTYNNSATQHNALTVDAKGRVTSAGAATTITPAFASITGTPTTLAGYGITNALTTAQTLAVTGDATAAATALSTGTIALTLASVGTAGTYLTVTTDAKGRVTSGTTTQAWSTLTGMPTTVAGYGITDALTTSATIDGGTF